MRIVITTQVFPPEIHPTARIVWELARSLSEAGHEVTVAAGYPHHPHGKILDGYSRKLILRETVGGVRVVRGWHATSRSDSIPARGFVYISQTIGTTMAALFGGRPELVINFGPPLVGPALSLMFAKFRSARVIPVIYDLYPDVAVEAGTIRNRALVRVATSVEDWIYCRSDRIVVISEGFRKVLVREKGVDEAKVCVIPAWIDTEEIRRNADNRTWRLKAGITRDAFVVLYAGTIGLVSGAEIMIDVAREWKGAQDALFVFVGEGRQRDHVEEAARGLSNVRFMDFQPREILSEMLSSADVGVMTLLPGRGRTSVPSKVLGYMAAEVPVLASCDNDSDSAEMIRRAGCGVSVPPGDAHSLSTALRKLYSDRSFCREAGRRGREFLERCYSRDYGTAAFQALVGELGREQQTLRRGGAGPVTLRKRS